MSLYPLKFTSIPKEKIWGGNRLNTILNKEFDPNVKTGESWEISGLEGDLSVVKNGFLQGNDLEELIEIYMGELVGDKVYEQFGLEFPLLIKFLDASENLSIQVHPDNEFALEKHKAYGKTEMWYIIESEKDSEIMLGFNREMDKNLFLDSIQNGNLPELINKEKAESDTCYLIPSGRIHAIGKGVLLAEIQQTSDINYRIYDWNRKDSEGNERELHLNLAKQVLDYTYEKKHQTDFESKINESSELVKCPFFTTNILEFNKAIENDYSNLDSFIIYICLEGNCDIITEDEESVSLVKGETILIPASLNNLTLTPKQNTKLLEVFIQSEQ
ncbi:MAG: mannose-6-phosphate isomerase [Ancylomarina sp.]|jgi:mannose-6-phosphate isomerase